MKDKMKDKFITTPQIEELLNAGDGELYVRYSAGPEVDRNGTSRDWAAGQAHAEYTLSVNNLVPQDETVLYDDFGYFISIKWIPNWALHKALGRDSLVKSLEEYAFLMTGRPWIMRAPRVGTDSDGSPLVDSRDYEFLGWWKNET